MGAKTNTLKNALIKAMIKTLGNVSESCKICGCSRTTYYEYYAEDEDFKKEIDEIGESNIDFVESKLMQLITGFTQDEVELFSYQGKVKQEKVKRLYPPDKTAIIFYLKTKGKDRGYIESTIQINKNAPVDPFEGKTEEEIDAILAKMEEEEKSLAKFKDIPKDEIED